MGSLLTGLWKKAGQAEEAGASVVRGRDGSECISCPQSKGTSRGLGGRPRCVRRWKGVITVLGSDRRSLCGEKLWPDHFA